MIRRIDLTLRWQGSTRSMLFSPEEALEVANTGREMDQSAMLLRDIGEIVVTWSQIENIWARIFQQLLFDGMRAPPAPGPCHADSDIPPRMERALAIWDSMRSGKARMEVVEAIAKVVLRNRPDDMARLKAALDETSAKRDLRDAIAHALFERENEHPAMGKVWTGPGRLILAARARMPLCGRDAHAEAPELLAQLDALKLKAGEVRMSLILPGDFDEPPPTPEVGSSIHG